MDDIEHRVNDAITQALLATAPDRAELDRDMPLSTAAGLDSVQIMNLVMEIEDTLDISVPVDVLADTHTLNELAKKLTAMVQSTTGDTPV
ncbi:MAG TPA: acyl carrier protein [Wenzhouxiangella sp.]